SSMLNLLATGKERDAAKRQEVSDRVGRLRAMLAGDREGDEAIAKFLEASTEADHLYTQGDEKLTAAARMLAEYQGLEMDENREAMRAWKEKNVGTYRALLAEGRDLLKRSATVQRKTLDEAIGVHDPASVSREGGLATTAQKRAADDGTEWLQGLISASLMVGNIAVKAKPIPKDESQRDFYDGEINLSRATNADTFVHEFGHHLNAQPHV